MKQRLSVAQIVECGGPGGTGNQVAALCNGLDPDRYQVTLIYSVRPGAAPKDYETWAHGAQKAIYLKEMVREISPWTDARAWLKLYTIFRQEHPDIVHAHSSKAGFLARTAAWAAGIKQIYYTPRGYAFLQSDHSRFSRWFYKFLESSASWIGDIVAVSEGEAQLARQVAGGHRVHIVKDAFLAGIDTPTAESPEVNEEKTVMISANGRLAYPRNPEVFVRLAHFITDTLNRVRCTWIGDGELRSRVDALINKFNLGDRLNVTGWLDHKQALAQLEKSDLIVHYSRWEGLPNVILEALALGKPVIASDIPGNRELVKNGETGYLVSSETELLERTIELVHNPQLRRKMGANGRNLIEREYDLKRMIGEISSIYSPATTP